MSRSRYLKALFLLALLQLMPTMTFAVTIDEEIEILRGRLYQEYFATNSPAPDSIITSQQADGSWADIDYASKALAYWPPLYHLNRLKSMARTYAALDEKSSDYALSLASKINKGLTYWQQKKPTSNNWWYQDIGKQAQFTHILILMGEAIPETMRNALCSYLVVTETNASGANLTDMATGLLVRGVVQNNVAYIQEAVTKIASVGKIQNKGKDGAQIDHTYLFHNQLIFSINYNVVTLNCISMWINMLRGLSFQFPEVAFTTTRDILLEGNRWMFRHDKVDWTTAGRFISIPTALTPRAYLTTAGNLLKADSDHASVYENLISVINQEKTDTLEGNKYFFRGEFMVNRRPKFYYSVKMCSNRVSDSEMGNGQNIKGYWLGMGSNCLMKDAREYDGIFPLWDWTKIPGTTTADELPSFGFGMKQGSSFSGGLSYGSDGIASMQVSQRGILAKKSWFVFENEVVCLGNGITGVTNENRMFSTIEQRRMKGCVMVDGEDIGMKSNFELMNPKTVYHDSTLYIFPSSQRLFLSTEKRTNNWYSISTIESKELFSDNVFALWYDHGRMPSNASYSYITVPYIHPDSIDDYCRNLPIKIVQATHNAHVVSHTLKKLTGAVFFSQGTVAIDSLLSVRVSAPCILMIDQRCEPIQLMVSDPCQNQSSITVTLKHKNYDAEEIKVELPVDVYQGNGVRFSSSIDRHLALGIRPNLTNPLHVHAEKGSIVVKGISVGEKVLISDAKGRLLYHDVANSDTQRYEMGNPGLYLVQTMQQCYKVIVE